MTTQGDDPMLKASPSLVSIQELYHVEINQGAMPLKKRVVSMCNE